MAYKNSVAPADREYPLSAQGTSLRKRVCQWMKRITSHSTVVTRASKKSSQANASNSAFAQCRHLIAAGMAAGDVTSAEIAKARRRFFSGKCMAGALCGMAWVVALLAQGPASAVLAIALNVLALIGLIRAWR